MDKGSNSILIVAGEPSGDNVGGLLAAELKLLDPEIELFGLGGDRMDVSGVHLRYHVNQLSFLGFIEVIKHIPFIKEVEADLLEQVRIRKPSLAILIDFPGFNMRLAAKLRAFKVPILYYVSPQIWAWGKNRIAKIRELVTKMVVVFEFEKNLYDKEKVPVEWYGHPLLEIVKPKFGRAEFLKKIGLSEGDKYIGLFPGSRRQEISRILPVMSHSIQALKASGQQLSGIVGCAGGIELDEYRRLGGKHLKYLGAQTYDLMAHSEFNLVASGTATLECAILNRPLFVLYKTSTITYLLAKSMIKIPYIGLVNVVAGRKIAPEFIQSECVSKKIAAALGDYLNNPALLDEMRMNFSEIRSKLGSPGASQKVAELVLRMIQ
jgi:lipid-A-disaccharide synthase